MQPDGSFTFWLMCICSGDYFCLQVLICLGYGLQYSSMLQFILLFTCTRELLKHWELFPLVLEKGKHGERYIIGGENITYNEFFGKLINITGKSHLLFHVPYPVMLTAASVQYSYSRLLSKDPLITPRWVRKYLHHWAVSSEKSIGGLGYQLTPLDVGLSKTVEWLNKNFAK